jgi:hypothetical protein
LPDRVHAGSHRHGRLRPLTPACGCRIPLSHFPTLQSPLRSTHPPHRCASGSTLSPLPDRRCPAAPFRVSWVATAAIYALPRLSRSTMSHFSRLMPRRRRTRDKVMQAIRDRIWSSFHIFDCS